MSDATQTDLRNRIVGLILDDLETNKINIIEANAAASGASAAIVAMFPEGELRDRITEINMRRFPDQVTARAIELEADRLATKIARLTQ